MGVPDQRLHIWHQTENEFLKAAPSLSEFVARYCEVGWRWNCIDALMPGSGAMTKAVTIADGP
jgi:hypothetical protein